MESRMAPFFMVSTQPQEATPFVCEQIVEQCPKTTVGVCDSGLGSRGFDDEAYARQLALLKTWRVSLDSPWSSAPSLAMPGQHSSSSIEPPSRIGLRRCLWPDQDPANTDVSGLRVRSGDEAPRKKQNDAAKKASDSWSLDWTDRVCTDKLLDHRQYLTAYRPISKCRETRAIEKDERRQLAEIDELRRRKQLSFCRSLASRRDDLFKANRSKRNDAAKCARACKAHFEAIFHRAEVEESKAGRKRLQALRANDMEAYSKLLEETKNQRLKFLLEQTDNYIVSITKKVKAQRQHEEYDEAREAEKAGLDGSETVAARNRRVKKRLKLLNKDDGDAAAENELLGSNTQTTTTTEDDRRRATTEYYEMTHKTTENVTQPKMMVGGQLKEYQMAGLSWLVSLYNNRLNGILADEMGLGKTIQSIALIAHLAEKKRNYGPFMVVAPLSTLSNWANEFAKWTPGLVALSYKGPPSARKEVQKEIQRYLTMRKRTGRVVSRAEVAAGKKRMMDDDEYSNNGDGDDDSEFPHDVDEDDSGVVGASHEKPNFSVLLTTYEYVMRDRAVLRKVDWQYIIVDEGHRMKNANSKFAQTLGNLYTAKRRLLLTGTPLQNSLPELWALLNFLLPSIFSSVDTFEGWFNKPFAQFGSAAQPPDDALGHEERMLVINRLHEVLRPFVLRRVKAAVLGQLPEKVEKVIRCDLSAWQKILYEQIRSRRNASSSTTAAAPGDDDDDNANGDSPTANGNGLATTPRVNRGGLNNVLMQLRKCCNHPYLFRTDSYRIDESMIRASGKFLVLDSMLPKFKAAGHRVLLFSQMTAVMDLLEEFFTFRGFEFLRLDGSTSADERERRVATFNDPCSPAFVFLLSTRAGGLGLNLASADTVVIFDSDWNPMMDAQAQDRAHRIGQRNDVRVFRLVAAAPVEERILARATDKLNMNSLVVEAGKFNKDSRAHERKQMLEELLKEYACADESTDQPEGSTTSGANDDSSSNGGGGGGPANGISEAQQLAEVIATSSEELVCYNRFDAERERRGEVLPPMTVAEVPDWVKAGADSSTANLDAVSQQQDLFDMFLDARQRAGRKKKDTPYYDSLSERNFLKLVESGSLDQPSPLYKAVGRPGALTVKVVKQLATTTRSSSGRRSS